MIGGLVWLVDMLGNVEWVADLGSNPRARAVWQFLQTPLGGLVVFGAGILWLVACSRMPLSSPVANPETAPRTARPAPAHITADEPPPNIVVLDTRIVALELDENGLIREAPTSNGLLGAVVIFRNEALGGRRLGPMNNARAHLTVKPANERTLTVNSGYWLDNDFNTVDIGPGEAHRLLVAISTSPYGKLIVLDDRRESVDRYEAPKSETFEATKAIIAVTLVGGWEAQYVREFHFSVERSPVFHIDLVR